MSNVTHGHAATTDSHGHDDGRVHAHVSSFMFLLTIFGALIFLTVATVAVSYVDLGSANTIVAVLVATMKASLVAVFFMHLRHDKPFNSVILISSFLFLGIFLVLSLDDLGTRGRVTDFNGQAVHPATGAPSPGSLASEHPAPAPGAPAVPHFVPHADDPSHQVPPAASHIEGEGEGHGEGGHEGSAGHQASGHHENSGDHH